MGHGLDQIVILHIGAGKHNAKDNDQYVRLMKKALEKSDVVEINGILEKSPLTNTGYGSSLNILGEVEIDASYIKSDGESGALSGLQVQVPTEEMFRIYNNINKQYSRDTNLSRPLSLHCSSLRRYMDIASDDHLVSAKSQKIYNLYKDRIFQYAGDDVNDTIGTIVIDADQTTLSTSSGGHFFKLPGRIGCGGIIGAAIYYEKIDDTEISCMCSGNGEQIIQHSLAQLIVTNVHRMDEGEYGTQLEKLLLSKSKDIYCGFIAVLRRSNGVTHLLYGHTTETFYFGTRVNDSTRVILSSVEQKGKFTFGEYKLQ